MSTTVPADSPITIVNGAPRGIGRAVAPQWAADGCTVVTSTVADQNRAELLRRVGSDELVAPRDYVRVRAEVSNAA